ncbi:MAG: hypothetical protein ACREOP_14420, partial [Thermodesulfobacteriota bacterium]
MKILIALSSLVIPVVFAVYGPIGANGAEGISTVRTESETVSAAPVGSAWAVECVNTGTRPGDIQAKALA